MNTQPAQVRHAYKYRATITLADGQQHVETLWAADMVAAYDHVRVLWPTEAIALHSAEYNPNDIDDAQAQG